MTKERARIKAALYLKWAEAAESKARAIQEQFEKDYKDFDWTEPIKIGHHSQRRHQRVFEKRNRVMRSIMDLEAKAKSHRSKSANLTEFANRNKGDAERKREEIRQKLDAEIKIGQVVDTVLYGFGSIVKINKKTCLVRTINGNHQILVQKHFCKPLVWNTKVDETGLTISVSTSDES